MRILETLKRKAILLRWWNWYFFEMPKNILRGWKNYLKFGFNYFSIPLLLKTFFSHWHRYKWAYPSRGLDIGKILETLISNLISRVLGAIIRFFLIIIGLLFEFFIFFAGPLLLIGWLFLPLLLVISFGYGFKILF